MGVQRLFSSSPVGRACVADAPRSFEGLSDVNVGRLRLRMPGVLPDVISGGSRTPRLTRAAGSGVPVLDLLRDASGARDHAPPPTKLLILERFPCSAIDDNRASFRKIRKSRKTTKLRIQK